MRRGETPDQVDDAISEFGWRAVQAGLHRMGREPTPEELAAVNKPHECTWVEDESGSEPPFDFCISCGKVRY